METWSNWKVVSLTRWPMRSHMVIILAYGTQYLVLSCSILQFLRYAGGLLTLPAGTSRRPSHVKNPLRGTSLTAIVLRRCTALSVRSSSSSQVFLEWPKQQRHHEDHYSQSKYSSIRQCCNSSGISMSSNGAGRLTGTERRWHHLVSWWYISRHL